MKKPYKNTVLSEKTCKHCGKHLKMNLVVKKKDPDLCYPCYDELVLQPRRENAPPNLKEK